MARDDERLERAKEEPIVSGIPDLPGITAALQLTPGLGLHLRGLADELLVNDFAGTTLTRAQREMLATATSAANDCFFCMDSHGAFATALLERSGATDQAPLIDVIKTGSSEGFDPKMRALLHIARTVQREPRDLTSEDIDVAQDAGATDADVQLAVLIAAAFSMYNRMVEGFRAERRQPPRPTASEPAPSPITATAARRSSRRPRASGRPALPGERRDLISHPPGDPDDHPEQVLEDGGLQRGPVPAQFVEGGSRQDEGLEGAIRDDIRRATFAAQEGELAQDAAGADRREPAPPAADELDARGRLARGQQEEFVRRLTASHDDLACPPAAAVEVAPEPLDVLGIEAGHEIVIVQGDRHDGVDLSVGDAEQAILGPLERRVDVREPEDGFDAIAGRAREPNECLRPPGEDELPAGRGQGGRQSVEHRPGPAVQPADPAQVEQHDPGQARAVFDSPSDRLGHEERELALELEDQDIRPGTEELGGRRRRSDAGGAARAQVGAGPDRFTARSPVGDEVQVQLMRQLPADGHASDAVAAGIEGRREDGDAELARQHRQDHRRRRRSSPGGRCRTATHRPRRTCRTSP